MKHYLPDCLFVWMVPHISYRDQGAHEDQLCEQLWADYKWDGINGGVVRSVRNNTK